MKKMKLHNLLHGILILLLISSLAFTTLFLTKPVEAGNVVSAVGAIELYNSDGVSLLTNYDFPLFAGGIAETALKAFFINNTGTQPVYVYWNISESSIIWTLRNPNQDQYDYFEDSTWKYTLGIQRHSSSPTQYWHPDKSAIHLDPREGIQLCFELYYTGEPNTAETFTMTISFYATDEDAQDPVVVALEDLKTEINGLPSEAFKHPRLAEWRKESLCRQIEKAMEKVENDNYKWAILKLNWLKVRIDMQILDPYKASLIEEIDEISSTLESKS